MKHDEHPIFAVDLNHDYGRTFKVIPVETCSVENNLSIANMDFSDFADSVDADGVFRGFADLRVALADPGGPAPTAADKVVEAAPSPGETERVHVFD